MLTHDGQGVARSGVHREGDRILNHAALGALHLAHFVRLRRDGHVLVNHADASLTGDSNRHVALGDGVHGGTHDGRLQLDVARKRRAELHVTRKHLGVVGHEQNVVVRQPFA